MADVHPTAVVDAGAVLAADAVVGPHACVGPDVELGEGVELGPHVVVTGHTRIGARTRVFPYACLGGEPQHLEYAGEPTRLEIGRDNVIREHVSIHVGTVRGGGCTRIGDANLLMNGSHVGHDCVVGSHVVVASQSGLAGHVVIEDHAVLGAYTGVHQHARIGESAMTAAGSMVSLDVPPFSLVAGDRARMVGLNTVGLERRGFPAETRGAIRRAHRIVFRSGHTLTDALARAEAELGGIAEIERFLAFLRKSERGFCR
ncbi:MAG TPA: acyl-ACP--UDP-N-acetylglucosamine O-acyltransferase [Alphaproteobacteria bacterium]|nr:acyl-ACP--UDP-N-acetylglucosamine O-acyltransferase [Alphaproteobacteria bacterium]